ncbi:DNA damage-inducible transcript 3 protein [Ambystoma mexicanum]|uniref:DNA damage-inducible transcript 3 protein n=1 Tax=Ambystoma mexicanum TaxID=8296 RepID=UPI0037E6FD9A
MTAESLPFSSCTPAPGMLSSWELEAWYEDLQDVLLSDINGSQTSGLQQNNLKIWDPLDAAFFCNYDSTATCCTAEILGEPPQMLGLNENFSDSLLEFLGKDNDPSFCNTSSASPAGEEQLVHVVQESDSGSINHTEDEDSSPICGTKRKRSSQPRGGKRLKEKEQEGDKKVSELVAENERLKGEIERLSAEVELTRKALIDRMVNLKKE